MRFVSLVPLGLLAVEALALPKPETAAKKGIRVQARRYRAEPSLEARDGNATASNDGGGWLLTAQVGPSSLTLNIDTGSSDLWVASTLMPSSQQGEVQTGHALYDPSQSSTAQPIDGESFDIAYEDGSSSSGPEYAESVTIGGANLPNMVIGVCNNLVLGSGSSSRNSDGPVGLGFQSINSASPNKEPTFAEALLGAGSLSNPLFTTYFSNSDDGFILFGETDPSLYTGSLTQVPIDNSTGFWIIDNVSFGVNGQQFSGPSPLDVICDTGGPGLDIPSDALNDYFGNVQGVSQDSSGTWMYPCGQDLPDFNVFFPSVLNGGPSSITIPGSALENGSGNSGSACYTWLGAASGSGSMGIPFFISQYIEWDLSGPTMSFAAQA